jgi:hypothetical protein
LIDRLLSYTVVKFDAKSFKGEKNKSLFGCVRAVAAS